MQEVTCISDKLCGCNSISSNTCRIGEFRKFSCDKLIQNRPTHHIPLPFVALQIVGPQNVRNFSYPVRIRWIKSSNLASFIYIAGYLNVRKMSEILVFRTFYGALIDIFKHLKVLFLKDISTFFENSSKKVDFLAKSHYYEIRFRHINQRFKSNSTL